MIAIGSSLRVAIGAGALALVAGCVSMADDRPINTLGASQPEAVTPVIDAEVSQNNLPPLPGQTELPSYEAPPAMQTADAGGVYVPGSLSGAPGGRDLSGGLTAERLLGRWTIESDGTSCALNLTYTQKGDTNRYRASVPGCAIIGLAEVASWQVVGNQVQLFDDADRLVAALAVSGDRFVGTSSGGVGISMA